jgi:hypothetical protein
MTTILYAHAGPSSSFDGHTSRLLSDEEPLANKR